MRIKRNEKIGNIPILEIRDYFNQLRSVGISKEGLRVHFGLNHKNVNLLVEDLLQNDFIEKATDEQQKKEYQLTIKGQALCAARCLSPMNKEKADKVFNEFMQRVEEINNDNYYLYKVKKLFLFGSYLNPDNDNFGDIDIAFELKRKIEDSKEFEIENDKRVEAARQRGKVFSSWLERLFFSATEVKRKLKNKSQYISLHEMTEGILEITKYKQIYPA